MILFLFFNWQFWPLVFKLNWFRSIFQVKVESCPPKLFILHHRGGIDVFVEQFLLIEIVLNLSSGEIVCILELNCFERKSFSYFALSILFTSSFLHSSILLAFDFCSECLHRVDIPIPQKSRFMLACCRIRPFLTTSPQLNHL